jgi:hypothetical protein
MCVCLCGERERAREKEESESERVRADEGEWVSLSDTFAIIRAAMHNLMFQPFWLTAKGTAWSGPWQKGVLEKRKGVIIFIPIPQIEFTPSMCNHLLHVKCFLLHLNNINNITCRLLSNINNIIKCLTLNIIKSHVLS